MDAELIDEAIKYKFLIETIIKELILLEELIKYLVVNLDKEATPETL